MNTDLQKIIERAESTAIVEDQADIRWASKTVIKLATALDAIVNSPDYQESLMAYDPGVKVLKSAASDKELERHDMLLWVCPICSNSEVHCTCDKELGRE